MSVQRLNDRSRRRIERSTGLDIRRAWANGGYTFMFVTADHRHGFWDKKTGEWDWDDEQVHFTSCRELFGDYPPRQIPRTPHRMKTANFDGLVMPGGKPV